MIKMLLVTYICDRYGAKAQNSVIVNANNKYAAINKAQKQLEE